MQHLDERKAGEKEKKISLEERWAGDGLINAAGGGGG